MVSMTAAELPVRLAGRVIVLDPGDRVLLFRYDDPAPNGRHWATPGGGLEAGEDYYAGAVRELSEETGWHDVPVDRRAVCHREVTMRAGGPAGPIVRQHERFFVARVATERRALGEVAAMHVSDGIVAARWWTMAELESTGEAVWPAELADLIRKVTS
jgi:ADP-ribose pyrophosphatase YjhB (NUDIX family)